MSFQQWLSAHPPSVDERATTLRLRAEVLGVRIEETGNPDARTRLRLSKDQALGDLEGFGAAGMSFYVNCLKFVSKLPSANPEWWGGKEKPIDHRHAKAVNWAYALENYEREMAARRGEPFEGEYQ